MNETKEVTFGSDPELHLFDLAKRRIVSAIPVIGVDKTEPIKLGDGINMYADNVLAETTFPPSSSKEEFISRFKAAFTKMQKFLGDRYRLVPKAAHVYHKDELKDPKSWEIGCSANYDAYEMKSNDPMPFKNGLRTGSCHIHLGNDKLQDFDNRIKMIKLLDVILGCSSVVFDTDKSSLDRRKYYGSASEHRPTNYGLEYRVLSPFVLQSPETIELVFDLTQYSLKFLFEDSMDKVLNTVQESHVKTAINKCKKSLAIDILKKIELPKDLFKRVTRKYNLNMYKNWKI